MYTRFFSLIIGITTLFFSLLGHAYDPMRTMRHGQITSGFAYSPFDTLTRHGAVASPEAISPEENQKFRFTFGSFSTFLQYKNIRNIADDIEVLIEEAGDTFPTFEEVQRVRDEVDDIVSRLQSEGNIISGMVSSFTFFPPIVAWTSPSLKGSLFFDYQSNPTTGLKSSPLNQKIPYAFAAGVSDGDIGINPDCTLSNPNNCRIESTATIDMRTVTDFSSYSLGYSQHLIDVKNDNNPYASGQLVVGGRANLLSFTTTISSINIGEEDAKEVSDIFDDLKGNTKKNQIFDIDLGVHWVSDRYTAGVAINNLFVQDVEYANGDKVSPGMPIAVHGTWNFIPESRAWGIRLHNDLTGQKNPVGGEQKWRTLSIGYASDRKFYIPGFDIGKRWSLVDQGLSYTTMGLKLFEILRLQMAYDDKTFTADNNFPLFPFIGFPLSFIGSASIGFSF